MKLKFSYDFWLGFQGLAQPSQRGILTCSYRYHTYRRSQESESRTANNTRCRQAVSMHNSNSRTAVRGTAEPSEFSLPLLPPLLVNT